MSVILEAISLIASGGDGTIETIAPAGVVSSNLLLCSGRSAVSTAISTPTDWNSIFTWTNWFNGYRSFLFWKIADETASDTPVITAGSGEWHTTIARFSGHNLATPIDTSWNNGGANETDPYTISNLTITNDGSMILLGSMTHFGNGSSAPDLTSDGYTLNRSKVDAEACLGWWSGNFNSGANGGVASLDFEGSQRAGLVIPVLRHHLRMLVG
jgi:hypothetical protein